MPSDLIFPENVVLQIEDDVKKLIQEITHFELSDDNETLDFVMCYILNNENNPPSQHTTLEKLEEFSTKYDYFGFPNYSEYLRSAIDTYLHPNPASMEKNESFRMLNFLLQLPSDTFKTNVLYSVEKRLAISRAARLPEEVPEEEKINWFDYLREGWEKFQLPSDEDADSDGERTLLTNTEATVTAEVQDSGRKFNELFANFERKEMIVPDEDSEMRKILRDAQEAKCWLTSHVQNCWWNGKRCMVSKSVYPSANFGLNWEKCTNDFLIQNGSPPTNYQYHDEYKIIRELFWILVADDSQIMKRIELLKEQISVPSLIQGTFRSLVFDVLEIAKKNHTLSSFCDEILCDGTSQVPFTIQAYTFAIKDICRSFLQRVIEQENIVQKQEDIYTLLTFHNNLRPDFQLLNFIYELHNEIVSAKWLEEVPWLSCVRLLSILFAKYEQHSSQLVRRIVLKMFFKVFKIYANIIDVWLTEGKLNDWKNEFFIQKTEDGQFVALPDDVLKKLDVPLASFFQLVSTKLLVCCQSIEFLCRLNRVCELRSEILKEGKLMDQFIEEVKRQSFVSSESAVEFQSTRNSLDTAAGLFFQPNQKFIDGEASPYLVNAFSDQLIRNNKSNDYQKTVCDSLDIKFESLDLMPTGLILERTLCNLIAKREAIIVGIFKSSIIDDYKFLDHVRNLTTVLCMDWSRFYDSVIILLEKHSWTNHILVKGLLYDSIENGKLPFGNLIHFTLNEENNMENFDTSVLKIVRAVDLISMQYEVQWPLNMIFTKEVIASFYEPLLKLILKINIAFFSIAKLRFNELHHIKLFTWKTRRLQLFRYWLMLLLQKLQSYLSWTVARCLNCESIEKSLEISTFTNLQLDYSNYLEKHKRDCLVKPEMKECIDRALHKVWLVCDDILSLWSRAAKLQLTDKDVAQSVELYVQCAWYLTKTLQKFVKKGEQSPLHDLWSSLYCIVENHRQNIPEDLTFRYSQQVV